MPFSLRESSLVEKGVFKFRKYVKLKGIKTQRTTGSQSLISSSYFLIAA
jgi:hypothetical protein